MPISKSTNRGQHANRTRALRTRSPQDVSDHGHHRRSSTVRVATCKPVHGLWERLHEPFMHDGRVPNNSNTSAGAVRDITLHAQTQDLSDKNFTHFSDVRCGLDLVESCSKLSRLRQIHKRGSGSHTGKSSPIAACHDERNARSRWTVKGWC